jgi:HSP20 family molecular chaperone IbpA
VSTAITAYRPSLLGSRVFNNFFDDFFTDFPRHMQQTTSGYPVADIFRSEDGSTVMEFALAGFTKEDLSIDVQPEKRSITVSAKSGTAESQPQRRVARRSFQRTYVNYDNNLDLSQTEASFENGLLTVTVPASVGVQPLSIAIT